MSPGRICCSELKKLVFHSHHVGALALSWYCSPIRFVERNSFYWKPLWLVHLLQRLIPLNSLCRSIANRLDYLYEISHVPEDSKIPITDFSIVNPYTIFNKPQSSLKKTIKKIWEHTHKEGEHRVKGGVRRLLWEMVKNISS